MNKIWYINVCFLLGKDFEVGDVVTEYGGNHVL